MEARSVRLVVERSSNFSKPEFWASYKLGFLQGDLADILDFCFRASNFSIVYITPEIDEEDEHYNVLYRGDADLYLTKVVASNLAKFKITSPISITFTSILGLNHFYSSKPIYSVYFSLSYCSLLILLSSILILALVTTLLERQSKNILLEFFENVWFNISNVLQQARSREPRRCTSKILFLLMLLEIDVLFAFYNANFQSGYTTSNDILIDRFEDLLTRDVKILFTNSSPSSTYVTNLIEHSDKFRPLKDRVWEIDDSVFTKFTHNGSLFKMIENSEVVVVDTVTNLKNIGLTFEQTKGTDALKLAKGRYFPSTVSFPMSKNISPAIAETINYMVDRFLETEQRTPFQRQLDYKIGLKTSPPPMNVVDPLTIETLLPIFLMQILGNVLAILLALYERC